MQPLAWSEALETHIDVIDRQHRGLVDLVNATATRLASDAVLSGKEVRMLLSYLKDYAEVHLGTEEALMALCGLDPDYTTHHHHNHARFLAQVGDMLENLGEEAVPDGRHLLAFLGDWLIRHISGEDQAMARMLHEARLDAGASHQPGAAAETGQAAPPALTFSDAVVRGTAALHASEDDVLSVLSASTRPALVIALDASLAPATVLHANAAAASALGVAPKALEGRPAAALFGPAQLGRFPVLISEAMVSGDVEGSLDCRCPEGRLTSVAARISHLTLHGQMAIVVAFEAPAARGPVDAGHGMAETASRARSAAARRGGRTVVSRHPLFCKLSPTEIAALERAATLVKLDKGQLLFQRGEAAAAAYMVIGGQMSLVVSNSRGVEKVLRIVDSEQIFGEVEVLFGCPYRSFARSLTATTLLRIPAAPLRELQASSPRFATAAMEHLGRRLMQVESEVEALTLHTALERIIDHLLEHAVMNDRGMLEATLPARKGVIASCLDLSPPTLSRAFQQLTDAGLINVSRRYVTIPDRDRLLDYRAQDAAQKDRRAAGRASAGKAEAV